MRLITKEQSKKLDRRSEQERFLSVAMLMESAGQAVAEEIHLLYRDKRKKILILSGPGNNGADGFVAARILKKKGFQNVRVVLVEPTEEPSAIWISQKEKLKSLMVEVSELTAAHLAVVTAESDIIVDAIYGVGLNKSVSDELKSIFKLLNKKNKFVVSVDVATGLDADTGNVWGACLKSNLTVTFGLAKPGMFLNKGPHYSGKIKVHRIGFPEDLVIDVANNIFAFGRRGAKKLLPHRSNNSNKSDYGHLYLAAGSEQFPGAGILSACSANRAGVGYVHWCSFTDFQKLAPDFLKIPETVFENLNKFNFSKKSLNSPWVIGPGLGVNEKTKKLILELKKNKVKNVLLDADAITTVAEYKLWPLPSTWIMTPHAGELSKLLQVSSEKIESYRIQYAKVASEKLGCIVVLKGFRTVVHKDSQSVIILSGNSALAKAGSGDVLSGFIGSFMAQGLSHFQAALLGCYLHGLLADEWIKQGHDQASMMPSDLIERISRMIYHLRRE